MTIIVPDWIVSAIFYGFYGAVFLCCFAVLLFTSYVCLHRWMQHRKVYGCALVWLTTKARRDKAEAYTYGVLCRIEEVLRESNSSLHADIKERFNRP